MKTGSSSGVASADGATGSTRGETGRRVGDATADPHLLPGVVFRSGDGGTSTGGGGGMSGAGGDGSATVTGGGRLETIASSAAAAASAALTAKLSSIASFGGLGDALMTGLLDGFVVPLSAGVEAPPSCALPLAAPAKERSRLR